MSYETVESPEKTDDEHADRARSQTDASEPDATPRSTPRLGAALSVLWWEERVPSSDE